MKMIAILLILVNMNSAMTSEFSNESELGITVANGNTDTENYNIRQSNSLQSDLNTYKFSGRILNGFNQGNETARYLLAALRYERSLGEQFSLYAGQGVESDKFAGYDTRHLNDIGAKYFIFKQEKVNWFVEAGYRYTVEKRFSGNRDYQNALRGYSEIEKNWNEAVSTKYTLEYVPQLSESKDYLINTEISISALLTGAFSIKTGYLLRYDNLPAPGVRTKTDSLLTTALVAKF